MKAPTVYDLKPRFQNGLRPACRFLEKRGASPNQVTIAAVVLCVAHGGWLALAEPSPLPLLLVPLTLLLRMALNAIDGMLATSSNQKTRAGALLNEMGDVFSDAALYLPFAFVHPLNPTLVTLFVTIGILVEMVGVVSVQIGSSRRYDGPVGKSDRALLFSILALAIGLGYRSEAWLNAALSIAIILSAYTLYNRGRKALSEA